MALVPHPPLHIILMEDDLLFWRAVITYVPPVDKDNRNWWRPEGKDTISCVSTIFRPFKSKISPTKRIRVVLRQEKNSIFDIIVNASPVLHDKCSVWPPNSFLPILSQVVNNHFAEPHIMVVIIASCEFKRNSLSIQA